MEFSINDILRKCKQLDSKLNMDVMYLVCIDFKSDITKNTNIWPDFLVWEFCGAVV